MPTSFKIKIKNPSTKAQSTTPPAGSNKRKRDDEEEDAEGSEQELLVVRTDALPSRVGERVDKERTKPKKRPVRDFTPPPPKRQAKKRRSVHDEDEEFDPGATSDDDLPVDIERSPPPVVEKKPTRQSSRRSVPTKKAVKAAHRNVILSDDDDDPDEYAGTPSPKPKARPSKGRAKPNAAPVIVARDQRKGLLPVSETKSDTIAGSQSSSGTPATGAAPAVATKLKLPTIKKKPPIAAAFETGASPATLVKEEKNEPVKALEPGKDLDLRDMDVYTQLFAGGGRQKAREKDEARRKELDAMRAAAREARERDAGKPFDMLAHSAAMNRFEQRLKSKNNLPPPSQIGSVFLMLRRFRPDR